MQKYVLIPFLALLLLLFQNCGSTNGDSLSDSDQDGGNDSSPLTRWDYSLNVTNTNDAIKVELLNSNSSPLSAENFVSFNFQKINLSQGLVDTVRVSTDLNLTIPSGATLGQVNGLEATVYLYLIHNLGTLHLAASSKRISDTTGSFSTFTIDNNSDDNSTLYSSFTGSGLSIKFLGRFVSTQPIAGVWSTSPTQVDLISFMSPEKLSLLPWTDVSFQAPWSNYGSGYQDVQYTRDHNGFVTIRGLTRTGSCTSPSTIFVLPVGYRPAQKKVLLSENHNKQVEIEIDPNGNVIMIENCQSLWLSLELSFGSGQ